MPFFQPIGIEILPELELDDRWVWRCHRDGFPVQAQLDTVVFDVDIEEWHIEHFAGILCGNRHRLGPTSHVDRHTVQAWIFFFDLLYALPNLRHDFFGIEGIIEINGFTNLNLLADQVFYSICHPILLVFSCQVCGDEDDSSRTPVIRQERCQVWNQLARQQADMGMEAG